MTPPEQSLLPGNQPLPHLQTYVPPKAAQSLPPGWKDAIGKKLTNKRIANLRKQGYFGGTPLVKLPPAPKPCCIGCREQDTKNNPVRLVRYSYMPEPGQWCEECTETFRNEERERVLAKREEKQRNEQDYQ